MGVNSDEKIRPVDPARFHQALGIYQAALAAAAPQAGAAEASASADLAANRGIVAVKQEFPDASEFHSLSLRLQRFAEIIGDRKLIKWGMVHHSEGGIEVHDAVINALAAAPFRKSGVLDKPAFHSLVRAEFNRLEAEESAS